MMPKRFLAFLSLLCLLLVSGCAAHQIKEEPDAVSSPAAADAPIGYGYPFRLVAFVLHPVGVVTDLVVVRPIYWVTSLAPGLFGYTAEDEAAQDAARSGRIMP
jgi:hypothetical protein